MDMDSVPRCARCQKEVSPDLESCPRCGSSLNLTRGEGGESHGPGQDARTPGDELAAARGVDGTPAPGAGRDELDDLQTAAESPRLHRRDVYAVDDSGDERTRPGPAGPRDMDTVGAYQTVRPRAAEEVSDSWIERQLVADRFRIIRCIGQGGMGKVYLAKDEILGRLIALKRVPQEIIFDGDARDDLRQETNRLLDLAHENIIRVHTYYDEPAWPFFAMEYLEGPTLKTLLRERKREGRCFSVDELQEVAAQVGRGLAYAHSKQLVHRDLKPANLMLAKPPGDTLTSADVVKITDFGISRVVADSTLRQTGVHSGTLPYMSPEQFRGEECTPRSDVYSLGATYYELLSGRPPYTTGDIGFQIMTLRPRPIPGVPRSINDVLLRAMSKDPGRRYASVEELTRALKRRRPYSGLGSLVHAGRRLLRPLATAAAALLLVYVLFHVDWRDLVGLSPPDSGPAASIPGVPSSRRTLEEVDASKLAFAVQSQLDESIPYATRSTDLRFQIRNEGELGVSNRIFHLLYFVLDPGEDRERVVDGKTARANGEEVPGALEFHLADLEEGFHVLRAAVKSQVRDFASVPLQIPAERTFMVDSRGPEFVVAPLRRDDFVETGPLRLVTFNDTCRLSLETPLNPGDIASASYRVVTNGQPGKLNPIADVRDWRIDRLQEGQNRFQIVAEDGLGNSRELELVVHRLFLRAVLERDRGPETRGNVARIRGSLQFERYAGIDRLPELRFYVNGEPVREFAEPFRSPAIDDPQDDLTFEALLILPRFSNSVELRYVQGTEICSFTPRVKIEGIEVAAPQVVIAQRLALNSAGLPVTGEGTLVVEGQVDPYFDGLKLALEHRKVSSPGFLQLVPDPEAATARFSHEVYLSHNETNEIQLECFYDGTLLHPVPEPYKVYYDAEEPDLIDGKIEFEYSGDFLNLRLHPTEEELSYVRIRREGESEWKTLSKREDGSYLHRVPMPRQSTRFEVELRDLVGNLARVSDDFVNVYFTGPDDTGSLADGSSDPRDRGELARGRSDLSPVAGPSEGEIRPISTGAEAASVRRRCQLLVDLEMAFRPYGARGEEMATTEVSEKAWNLYLHDTGNRISAGGIHDRPMTVADGFDEELVLGFPEWLEERCDDGYDYFIPTTDQWRMAFTGADDPIKAPTRILRWFRGDLEGGRFTIFTENRYGRTRVSPIGSRKENQTVTGLLDMESNVQELVRGDPDASSDWYVIGGYNSLRSGDLSENCIKPRPLDVGLSEAWLRDLTGFRVARRPLPGRGR